MKWYQKPVAAIGAMRLAYQEMFRGRRVGVCEDCGRLNHATAELCLCGGAVDANPPPEEVIDDPYSAEYDSMELIPTVLLYAVNVLFAGFLVWLSYKGVATGDFGLGFAATALAVTYGALG